MKMKSYESFDAFLADKKPKHQAIIRALRRFVRRAAPQLEESVKWGNGVWLKGKAPVSYAYCGPDHVQFGFFRGASLKDPKQLLQGKGAYVRYIKLFKPSDLDAKAFGVLLRQAAR